MGKFTYRELGSTEINLTLFNEFERYQEVTHCWRKEHGSWLLKEIAFTEQWNEKEYEYLISCLQNTLKTGGVVIGAFSDKRLVGFASVENIPFGSTKEYLQLSSLHTSCESRGKGIGKILFKMACDSAKRLGAKKLYISAHSSEESQAFYRVVGCVEALEYNKKLVKEEPCDCQLEFILNDLG